MKNFPENYEDLLKDETCAFVFLATINPDGTPQLTPVWFSASGDYILINSARGRIKDRNMRSNPHVALAIADPTNPYRYVQIRGLVVEITSEGARAHIDHLAKKYQGLDKYDGPVDQERLIYKIRPEKSVKMG